MQNHRIGIFRATALLCAGAFAVLTACGGSSSPVITDGGFDTDSDTVPFEINVAEKGNFEEGSVALDGRTTWQEVFGTLTPSEQSCIRDKFDEGDLYDSAFASVMDQLVLESLDSTGFPDNFALSAVDFLELELEYAVRLGIFACAPVTFVTTVFQEAGVVQDELNDEEKQCLREKAHSIEPTGLIANAIFGDGFVDPASLSLLACAPASMLALISSRTAVALGVEIEDIVLDELSDAEVSCIQEHARSIDLSDLSDLSTDTNAAAESIFACAPAAFAILTLSASAAIAGEGLSDEEESCLRDLVLSLDPSEFSDDTHEINAFGCAPTVFLGASLEFLTANWDVELTDEEKSCARDFVRSLDPSQHSLDSLDIFVAGTGIYACAPIALATMTLQNADVDQDELSDDEKQCLAELARPLDPSEIADDAIEVAEAALYEGIVACAPYLRDEFEDPSEEFADATPVPTATWEPPPPPPEPFEEGREGFADTRADDHGNDSENATAAAVDEPIGGEIEDYFDTDFFVVQAEPGVTYQIDVTPITMTDPTLELFDASLEFLDYSDDYEGLAPRIYWEAPSSGTYYVAVEGYDEGTYTLTIASQ